MTKVFFDILLVNNSIARFGGRLVRYVSLALLLTVAVCPAAWGQEAATDGLPSTVADSISVADSVKKDSVSSELPLSPNAMEDILNYKAKDGSFKGSFKAYSADGGKLKATKVDVTGVMVDGVGYGTATVKKVGAQPVTIGPGE